MPRLGEIKYIDSNKKDRRVWHACVDCGKERWVRILKGLPLNLRCRSCDNRIRPHISGEKHHRWKGGRIKQAGGYILIRLYPDDFFYPMANKRGFVLEHRLVVAKALNRCLLPWETIHHKEGYAKDDNRYPEVLELLPNRHKHDALTKMINYIRLLEREIERLKSML